MVDETRSNVKISPHNPQRGMGDNGGPPLQKFTAKHKVERIKEVLEMDITAAQKCIGIGIVCEADTDWITPELSTDKLRQYASVKDRETVYRATKELKAQHVVNPIREEGRPNRYVVLPSEAIDAAIDEIDAASPTSRVSPEPPTPIKPDGVTSGGPVGFNPTTPVPSNPTTPIEPVGSNPTGRVETDAPTPSPSCAHASEDNKNKTNTYLSEREEEKDRGCGGKEKPEEETPDLEDEEAQAKASPLDAFNLYNDMALRLGLQQARTLTPGRRKAIAARMREHAAAHGGGLEAWKVALDHVERSAFLQGSNSRGWRATLDFLCQASSFTKVVEGTFGNGAHAGSGAGSQRPKVTDVDRIAQIAREIEEKERRKAPNWRVPHEH